MRKYLKTITNHSSMESSILPLGDGLAITVKKGETYE
jgi:predicted O-methyltransferase YrrM